MIKENFLFVLLLFWPVFAGWKHLYKKINKIGFIWGGGRRFRVKNILIKCTQMEDSQNILANKIFCLVYYCMSKKFFFLHIYMVSLLLEVDKTPSNINLWCNKYKKIDFDKEKKSRLITTKENLITRKVCFRKK